ncbi:hypothetical protein [Rubinisphaera margarita]|uniref:hypothetical protein n=1 Tax=Rubinisphaera margarita TaxID=2909586 RepID=UPI001EE9163A|nr:hypothetical protein [Rubinisphaera margarita]MCG6157966.1 hypothetical protein [Rubinisphaera margarita]
MSDDRQKGTDFASRPASAGWEQVTCSAVPQLTLGVWFKPATFPMGVVLAFPQGVNRAQFPQLTMRMLLDAMRLEPSSIISWAINGMTFDAAQGTNPLLDQPLPPSMPGADPQIYVMCAAPVPVAPPMPVAPPPMAAAPMPQMAPRGAAQGMNRQPSPQELEWLDGIDAEWNASLNIEADLHRQRKRLVDMQSKLKTLNRDLNSDERTYSSSQDKKDWQDARRWLRDCSTKLSRNLKDYDIGFTSAAGQRTWFEETYKAYVETKLPFEGMEQAFRDYQMYHKSLQTLNTSIKSAVQYAAQNGERRAQRLISQIQAKVREGNAKKNFLGVITGS